MFEIIERAEDVYFQGMRNDIHEMDEFGKK